MALYEAIFNLNNTNSLNDRVKVYLQHSDKLGPPDIISVGDSTYCMMLILFLDKLITSAQILKGGFPDLGTFSNKGDDLSEGIFSPTYVYRGFL
jgi:hypothetical protein